MFPHFARLERHFVSDRSSQDQSNGEPVARCSWSRTFTVSARPDVVADVRRQVALLARKLPFTDQDIEDVKLAVGEAVTNAIKHGSPLGERNRVTMHCEQIGERFVVEIHDEGPGFDLESRICRTPDHCAEDGRGLYFMEQLMDGVSVRKGSGAVVRLEKLVRVPAIVSE